MQEIKTAAGKIIAAGVACAILDIILHAVLAPTYTYDYAPSFFVETGLFRPAAGLALLIIFILLGIVFVLVQKNLPGSRTSAGLRFGVAFGGLWLIGVPGMSIFFGSPLLHEILGGACDCASIVVLGILLGVTSGTRSPGRGSGSPQGEGAAPWMAVPVIAIVFIIGQYLAFLLMSKAPYFNLTGFSTFAWTAVLGVWAGAAYWLLMQGAGSGQNPARHSLYFGGIIFGTDWMLFNLFVLLFIAVPVTDPIILAGFNIASVTAGVYIIGSLSRATGAGHS